MNSDSPPIFTATATALFIHVISTSVFIPTLPKCPCRTPLNDGETVSLTRFKSSLSSPLLFHDPPSSRYFLGLNFRSFFFSFTILIFYFVSLLKGRLYITLPFRVKPRIMWLSLIFGLSVKIVGVWFYFFICYSWGPLSYQSSNNQNPKCVDFLYPSLL